MKRILIAGIGNIFLGDDAFGVEVVRTLLKRPRRAEVNVIDFGVRTRDLANALKDGYEAVILVDATPRGETPGTVSLIEPGMSSLDKLEHEALEAEALNSAEVLKLARKIDGAKHGHVYLVSCEPARLVESEDGDLGLSEPVHAAVPRALAMIESLVEKIFTEQAIHTHLAGAGKELL